MRTIIDLPEDDIKHLDIIAKHMDVSRTELVRRSVAEYLAKTEAEPIKHDIFGKLESAFKGDSLEVERKWRAEWNNREASLSWGMHDSAHGEYGHGAPHTQEKTKPNPEKGD